MYKNKKTILIGLSDSDYNSLRVISEKFDVSIVEAVRIAIRSYSFSRSNFSLSRIATDICSVRSQLQELILK